MKFNSKNFKFLQLLYIESYNKSESESFFEFDINKVFKELLKLSVGNNQKIKGEALSQLVNQLKDSQEIELSNNLENILVKVMGKLALNSNNGEKNA